MSFIQKHIGPEDKQQQKMLNSLEIEDLEALSKWIIPKEIQITEPLSLPAPVGEKQYLKEFYSYAEKNDPGLSFIGQGYYGTHLPKAVERHVLCNAGWYTAYTPYQAEISQGRLEALLNFQTLITDLTGMDLSNSSLLDEGSSASEAMLMGYRVSSNSSQRFVVAKDVFSKTVEIIKGRAEGQSIEVVLEDPFSQNFAEGAFGVLLQYPSRDGQLHDYRELVSKLKERGVFVIVAADLLALCLLTPPGDFGVDVVVGCAQRFGNPLGFGGPHAAYFATRKAYQRLIPGRVVGISKDSYGNKALRLALQTREQHIRREKATSNICTAQALLAVLAGFYAIHHGPEGMKKIAEEVHQKALWIDKELENLGLVQENTYYFDTLCIRFDSIELCEKIKEALEAKRIFLYSLSPTSLGLSVDETHDINDLQYFINTLSVALGSSYVSQNKQQCSFCKIPKDLLRQSPILKSEVFSRYSSETQLMRYIKKLESKDLSLTHSMIPLGSCTMKLNAVVELEPLTCPKFANLHPLIPQVYAAGMLSMLSQLEDFLSAITQMDSVSLQPNSGAQGEYAGLMVIRAYLKNKGQEHRKIALIPSSAHGTNPASAKLAGFDVCVLCCDDLGNIDLEDLKLKLKENIGNVAVLMITYPSTHGVFEEDVVKCCDLVHEAGGQVYFDGANLNAMMGLSSPHVVGADVCHINLHKTFCIPHGGGGPGMGPIAVASHLSPYLPEGSQGIHGISSASYGSALISLISYGFIRLMGSYGLKQSSQLAILNANYMKKVLEKHYSVLFVGKSGFVAHEFILDLRPFKASSGVEVEDVAKRLMDYGFHAPTISWPVAGTMMIEPTESEDKKELDRFCEAMISIREEIREIEKTPSLREDNVLKRAPHTYKDLLNWGDRPYSIEKGCFPLGYLKENKYWPPVNRINNAYGDRNLVCSCSGF
jgi:glycine dehydrogenase